MRRARAAGKALVVSGCVPQANPRSPVIDGVSVVGVQQIDRIVDVVEQALQVRVAQWRPDDPVRWVG